MSFVKNYNPGTIRMDLPTSNYIYELPLLSFSDIHGAVNLSLIFNCRMKEERGNLFHIAAGYKLNLQKHLIVENGIPRALLEEDGTCTNFISTGGVYVLDNDDQRILRPSGTDYVLENTDYSREIYDQTGKIKSVRDKYDNIVLVYEYNTSGQLTAIIYRYSNYIYFTYSGGLLTKIAYAGCETILEYDAYVAGKFKVNHYSGLRYTLFPSSDADGTLPWTDFRASVLDPQDATYTTYSVDLQRFDEKKKVKIISKTGIHTVDTTIYAFPEAVSCSARHSQVEVTNNAGVTTRLQYQGKHLYCSYEVMGDSKEAPFVGKYYNGRVQLYGTADEIDCSQAHGAIIGQQGIEMTKATDGRWNCDVSSYFAVHGHRYYLLTGCIRSSITNSLPSGVTLHVTSISGLSELDFYTPLMPGQKWTFFAYKIPLSENCICAYIDGQEAEMLDLRLVLYSPELYNTETMGGRPGYYITTSEDILINRSDDSDVIIPLRQCYFTYGSSNVTDLGAVTYNDILKYRLNQRKQVNTREFYSYNGKEIFVGSTNDHVEVCHYIDEDNTITYDLADCYLGRRTYSRKGIEVTEIVDDSPDYFLISRNRGTDGTVFFAEVMDSNLDVIATVKDGVQTLYTRNDGLIVQERVGDLYTRGTEYDTSETEFGGDCLITATDEFGNVTRYALDPTWGTVKQITLPDNTTITDTYDGDMCTLTKRTFGNSSGRSNSLSYDRGNLSGLDGGNLHYSFAYTDVTKLASVAKNTAPVEDHTYNDDDTNIKSYYPSQGAPLHATDSTYDAYGRLSSIAGVLTNTYDAWPAFDPDTGELNAHGSGRNALLATSTDEIRGHTARYTYNENNGQLAKKEVTSKTDYATKISTEEFTYDTLNRLTNNTCTYQDTNTVTGAIEYATDPTDPNADNRADKYTYSISNGPTAITETEYDSYKRLTQKKYTIGSKTFTRSAVYTKTRLDYQSDSAGGTTDISHDACGRISKAKANADNKTTWYTYDQYGQLIRENNQALAKSFVYVYNNDGNLTSVKEYGFTTGTLSGTPVTTAFGYSADKLTVFGGTAISYDAMGCPTVYEGKSAAWTRGKLSRLSSGSSANGTEIYSFSYNALGQRVKKAYAFSEGTNPIYGGRLIDSEKRFYYDNSGRLIAENTVKQYYGADDEEEKIIFLYDESSIIGMQYTLNGVTNTYYFHRNPMGDVVGIYNLDGKLVAKYLYDAWGNCTISGETTNVAVATANPIRYRGYYYDEETGLYYCNARYYSPKWRRFISPDDTAYLDPSSVNGLNQYCYCGNDPVNIMCRSQYVNSWPSGFAASAKVASRSQNTNPHNAVKTPFLLPQWVNPLSTAIDHAFSVINPIRSAAYTLMHTNLWDLMRLDGVTELPGALSTTATVVGWGLGLVGGVFAGCEKYASGASVISSVLGGLINAGISIGGMYAATGIATWGMGMLAASTALPGGVIILMGAAAAILIGVAINHALTKWNIAGETIEGHLNNFVDWLIFWD